MIGCIRLECNEQGGSPKQPCSGFAWLTETTFENKSLPSCCFYCPAGRDLNEDIDVFEEVSRNKDNEAQTQ